MLRSVTCWSRAISTSARSAEIHARGVVTVSVGAGWGGEGGGKGDGVGGSVRNVTNEQLFFEVE